MAESSNLVVMPSGAIVPSKAVVIDLVPLAVDEDQKDSPRGPIIAGTLALVLLVGVFGSWSATMSVASGAIAPGKIIVEGNRRAVQHRDGGPIQAVLVHEGQKVEKGQSLIELDLSDVAAEAATLKSLRLQMMARLARLKAEAANEDKVAWPDTLLQDKSPEVASIIRQEGSLFEARKAASANSKLLLEEEIEGSRRQISGLIKRLAATREQHQSLIDERESLQPLLDKGLVVRTRVLALQRAAAGAQAEIESIQNSIAAEEAKIIIARGKIDQQQKDWQQAVAKDITDAEARLADAEPRLSSAQRKLGQAVLVAPEAGYVYNLAVFSPGATIVPGQTALEIVPAEEALVLQVEISPSDIDRIHPPANVTIHLQPYDTQLMATVHGTLQKISADRFDDQDNKRSWFKGIVTIDPAELAKDNITLVPGMPGDAIIETGERTILSYLLSPLFRIFNFALRER